MKPTKTIDELCGEPEGSYKQFVKQKESYQQKIEANRKARIAAHRQGLPLPELGFEAELWMVA